MSVGAEASTIVAVPLEVAYRAASDLAQYSLFMVAARRVAPSGAAPLTYRWFARAGFAPHSVDVELIECVPNERVAWRSRPRGVNDGSFDLLAVGDQTHVTLRWKCDHAGMRPDRAVSRSLANFKRAVETGQRQRRPADPVLVAALAAVAATVVGGAVGMRARTGSRRSRS
jgi:uncharacterized membrane protein